MVSAEQALKIGLIEEVVDQGFAKIVAVSLANKVAGQSPAAVAVARKLIEDSPNLTLDEHLKRERAATLGLVGGSEQLDGVAAFLAKRAPSWRRTTTIEPSPPLRADMTKAACAQYSPQAVLFWPRPTC
ncbi:enoyl-CoA hydratase [Chromobacterium violaceum]|uniref:Enoyl-CoA hydratase n=1 Tax=Chromobacterium violaceum TaxID=536 RepID=A0A447TGM2_CHRVL|nr:enoyl-CoA hydratase [Chromobacterium violaceum]